MVRFFLILQIENIWDIVFLRMLIVTQLVKKLLAFVEGECYSIHKTLPLDPVLSQTASFILASYFCKIHADMILNLRIGLPPSGLFPSAIRLKFCKHFLYLRACYIPRPSHHP
jgi:hypothetical protein